MITLRTRSGRHYRIRKIVTYQLERRWPPTPLPGQWVPLGVPVTSISACHEIVTEIEREGDEARRASRI